MRHLRQVASLVHSLLLFFAVLCAVVIVASLCQGVRDAAAYVTYALAIVAYCAYAHAIRCLVPEGVGEPEGRDAPANSSAHGSPDGLPLLARVQNARRTLLALFVVEALVSGIAVLAYLWVARSAPGTPIPGIGLALAPGFPDLSALSAIFGTVDTSSTSPRFLLDAPLGIFVLLLWAVERGAGAGGRFRRRARTEPGRHPRRRAGAGLARLTGLPQHASCVSKNGIVWPQNQAVNDFEQPRLAEMNGPRGTLAAPLGSIAGRGPASLD